MAKESMTPHQRLWAAVRLEQPDRVPVVPLLTPEPAACLAGMTQAQVSNDSQMALSATFQVFDEFGGWDSLYGGTLTPVQYQVVHMYPTKVRIPGKDLPENYIFQILEEEVLRPDDYQKICDMGFRNFYYQDYLWRISDLQPGDLPRVVQEVQTSAMRFREECDKRNVEPFVQASALHPFFMLSLMRSFVPFTQDLYFNPEPVERVLKLMTAELIAEQLPIAKASGINIFHLTEERASTFYYPPAVFERFWWPYTQEIIDAFWSEGIVTLFHLDTCWDKNLPYFKKLPKGSAIIELDSMTDIFLAKEVLGDHLCLHGDVPASLLSIGKPEEVATYCKRLIREVGKGGGFILGTGCCAPPDCRPENFRAMIETGKNNV